MTQLKTETLNLRVTPDLKCLIRAAADHQHRTVSNFVEALVLEHCEREGLALRMQGGGTKQGRATRVQPKP